MALVTVLPLILLASLFSTVLCPPPTTEPNSFSKYALRSLGLGKKNDHGSLHQTLCYPANQYYTHVLEPYVYPAIEDVRTKVHSSPVYKEHIEPHCEKAKDAATRIWNGPVKPVVDRVSRGANKLYRQYIAPHVPYVKAKFIEATAPLTLHAKNQYNTHLAHHVKAGKHHACVGYKNLKGYYHTASQHPFTKQARKHACHAYGVGKQYSNKAYAFSKPHAEYAYRQGKHHFHSTVLPKTYQAVRAFSEFVAQTWRLIKAHAKLFYDDHLAEHVGPHVKKFKAAVGPYCKVFDEKVYTPYVAPVVAAVAPHAKEANKNFWQLISDKVPGVGNIAESRGSTLRDKIHEKKLNAEAMREAKKQQAEASKAAKSVESAAYVAKKSAESAASVAKKSAESAASVARKSAESAASQASKDYPKVTDKIKKDAKTAASVAESAASVAKKSAESAASQASKDYPKVTDKVKKDAKTAASVAESYASDASKSIKTAASSIEREARKATDQVKKDAPSISKNLKASASSAETVVRRATDKAKKDAESVAEHVKASVVSAEAEARRATDKVKKDASSVSKNVKASVSSASKVAEKSASSVSKEAEKATAHVKKEASSASVHAERSASSASLKAKASASSASIRAKVSSASVERDVEHATDSVKKNAASATEQAKASASSAHKNVKDTAEKVKKGAERVAEAAGVAAAVGAEKAKASASSAGSVAADGTDKVKASVASATDKAKASAASAGEKAKASASSASGAAAVGTAKAKQDAKSATEQVKQDAASASQKVASSASSAKATATVEVVAEPGTQKVLAKEDVGTDHGAVADHVASLKKKIDTTGRSVYGKVQAELVKAYQKFIDHDIPERQAIGVQSLDREITRMFNGLDRLYSNSKTLTRDQVAESVRMSDAKVSKVLQTVRHGVASYQDRIADPAKSAIADAKAELEKLEHEVEGLGKRLTANKDTSNREWASYKGLKRDVEGWKAKIETSEPGKKLKEVQQKAKVAIAEVQTEFDEMFGGWREHRDRIRQVALDRIEARETVAKEKEKANTATIQK